MAGGRQREFDKQQALENAMKVFWKKGFVGASLTDLTQSMGINKPSMYATFGNKEQLFIQATENYIENYAKSHLKHLNQENLSLNERLKNYMMSILSSQCSHKNPKGCYISLCVSEAAADDLPHKASETVDHIKNLSENLLTDFLNEEKKCGQLESSSKPKEIAQYIVTVLHGLAAMARAGKTKDELQSVVQMSLTPIAYK